MVSSLLFSILSQLTAFYCIKELIFKRKLKKYIFLP
ncbi:hypothetical protein CLOLEP_03512 [[Clostridium] leptum DSM 753]|uniref:Uncharacterized protein n=1 Tax=[Clostridium] leptum DSM 753 TaxID=428125 RepID=A7VY36_9FIRM|nr:hypothetical protein CLOLEP_03512 [[Clostridium] leptum DSM 753]